ncbi:MAG: hypothetical protein WKH64_15040 [Chloroflexia bacterium]
MMSFFERFLGGPVRHYDFTWMRAVAPGFGTPPHGDVVFMGRGTHDLYTAWTPLGDVDFETGGLMVLEGSNNLDAIKEYTQRDVDTYCSNIEGEEDFALARVLRLALERQHLRQPGRDSAQPSERWLTSDAAPTTCSSSHHSREPGQPFTPHTPLVRHAVPARERAGGRALGRRGARRPRPRRQARSNLLRSALWQVCGGQTA